MIDVLGSHLSNEELSSSKEQLMSGEYLRSCSI
jgi:hypothetical protein